MIKWDFHHNNISTRDLRLNNKWIKVLISARQISLPRFYTVRKRSITMDSYKSRRITSLLFLSFFPFYPNKRWEGVITPAAINMIMLGMWHLNVEGKIRPKIFSFRAINWLFQTSICPCNCRYRMFWSNCPYLEFLMASAILREHQNYKEADRKGGGGDNDVSPLLSNAIQPDEELPGCARY